MVFIREQILKYHLVRDTTCTGQAISENCVPINFTDKGTIV